MKITIEDFALKIILSHLLQLNNIVYLLAVFKLFLQCYTYLYKIWLSGFKYKNIFSWHIVNLKRLLLTDEAPLILVLLAIKFLCEHMWLEQWNLVRFLRKFGLKTCLKKSVIAFSTITIVTMLMLCVLDTLPGMQLRKK